MPVEIELNELPAGYSESSARGGGMIKVSQKGFYSSEDGEELIKRLEGFILLAGYAVFIALLFR